MYKRKISQVTGGGPALNSRRRSVRTGAKGGGLGDEQKDTQICWGRYLKPNGWKHVAGNREDHIFIPVAWQKYSTYIIKNAGEEGVHFFDGYAGLKKHFVDKMYPSIVGKDIPDITTNAFRNWFKKRNSMIQYSPEPTPIIFSGLPFCFQQNKSNLELISFDIYSFYIDIINNVTNVNETKKVRLL